jgi:CHAD domain-containing protein
VHDLRVSIRRLRECLRIFKHLFPPSARRKIRKELRKLMTCAELVRSADIALGLLKKAGLDRNAREIAELREQRVQHRAALNKELKSLASRPYTRAWREALGL